jgi:hypothetical protein
VVASQVSGSNLNGDDTNRAAASQEVPSGQVGNLIGDSTDPRSGVIPSGGVKAETETVTAPILSGVTQVVASQVRAAIQTVTAPTLEAASSQSHVVASQVRAAHCGTSKRRHWREPTPQVCVTLVIYSPASEDEIAFSLDVAPLKKKTAWRSGNFSFGCFS